MAARIQILHLEDEYPDSELVVAALRVGGVTCDVRWVETGEQMQEALTRLEFDLILTDYNLRGFDGQAALALSRKLAPTTPVIFVSGFIGEETALECLKQGATDYVFKHNLARLVPAVNRALQELKEQRERRRAQAALQESESTLRSFFETAPFMMGILELWPDDFLHLAANAASAGFWGANPEALRRRQASELGHAPDRIREWVGRLQEAQRQRAPLHFAYVDPHSDPPRHLSVTVSELPAVAGQPARFCYVAEDVTTRIQLEQQFLRAQRMESIGTLAGGIAHDLNNVLSPILTTLNLFRTRLTDPADQELLLSAEASARRGTDIVRQVLTFARGQDAQRRSLSPATLLAELERFIREAFPRSIRIDLAPPADLWPVEGDPTQLYQVLMNLCLNARDAMPDGGTLTIQAGNVWLREAQLRQHPEARVGPYLSLRVTDSGSGISAEVLPRIFDPFFTTKALGKGTGLGLPTVLSIVKGHGGFMEVNSLPGRGTEFIVFLPAQPGADLTTTPTHPEIIPRGEGQWILVVDDESAIRQATRVTLEQEGYRVSTAGNGTEALAVLQENRGNIQVVLTDLMMPLMDGSGLIEVLQKVYPQIRIVVTSGLMDQHTPWFPAHDQIGFLPKPFTGEGLLSAIYEALQGASELP